MVLRHGKLGLSELFQDGEEGPLRIGQSGVEDHKIPGGGGQFSQRLRWERNDADSPSFDVENASERILAGNVVVKDQDSYVRHRFFSYKSGPFSIAALASAGRAATEGLSRGETSACG